MSTLTKQQQEDIAERLDRLFDPVYLRCDGYLVSAALRRTGKNKLAIVVYVNDIIAGKWWNGEDEEPRRFWRPSHRMKLKGKEIKLMERVYGKRECRKRGYYDKVTYYFPEWNRPMPFIRHILKHNNSVKLIDQATYSAEIEAMKREANV